VFIVTTGRASRI